MRLPTPPANRSIKKHTLHPITWRHSGFQQHRRPHAHDCVRRCGPRQDPAGFLTREQGARFNRTHLAGASEDAFLSTLEQPVALVTGGVARVACAVLLPRALRSHTHTFTAAREDVSTAVRACLARIPYNRAVPEGACRRSTFEVVGRTDVRRQATVLSRVAALEAFLPCHGDLAGALAGAENAPAGGRAAVGSSSAASEVLGARGAGIGKAHCTHSWVR